MKERGILFSGEMVRAILDGRKTQTRRVIPNQSRAMDLCMETPECRASVIARCHFGQSGDRLWVRETFIVGYPTGVAGEWSVIVPTGERHQQQRRAFYRADGDDPPDEPQRPWRPSIHMPRWASRLTLEVTAVRVERVRSITPADAVAEAADHIILNTKHPLRAKAYERGRWVRGVRYAGIVDGYAALWDSLNAKRGYGWDVNPWVWVIEFRRVEEQRAAA